MINQLNTTNSKSLTMLARVYSISQIITEKYGFISICFAEMDKILKSPDAEAKWVDDVAVIRAMIDKTHTEIENLEQLRNEISNPN